MSPRSYGKSMFSFMTLPNFLPKCLYHFASPLAINENSCCSTSSSAFDVVSVLNFGNSNRCVVVSHYCREMTYDVEHLFMCLFTIYISSLMRCLFKSFAQFLHQVALFSSCSVLRVLCMF